MNIFICVQISKFTYEFVYIYIYCFFFWCLFWRPPSIGVQFHEAEENIRKMLAESSSTPSIDAVGKLAVS